jgi:hypothetical protein
MQWVASKYVLVVVVLLPTLIGALAFIGATPISQEPQAPLIQYCFDERTATIDVTTLNNCSNGLLSLGSGTVIESVTATGATVSLHPLLLNRFNAAKIVAARQGVNLYITSGFRTLQRQGELFREAISRYGGESEAAKWVLPPRFSHHPKGLAIDINYPGDRAGARWLERNGYRFGLCLVYANEWWHFEAVTSPGEPCPPMAPNALVDLTE